jgi:tetratricopeptide (TPR) repeat protein
MFYAQQNQLQDAAGFLQKAIALRPDYPEALNNLGVLFVREQDYARAAEQFKSCILVHPVFDQSYLNLARLYVMQNDRAKAKEILQDLLRLQPENANAKQAMDALNSLP